MTQSMFSRISTTPIFTFISTILSAGTNIDEANTCHVSRVTLHDPLGLLQVRLPVGDHVLLRPGDVLQVEHDDVLEVRHAVVLEQLHLHLGVDTAR